MPKACGSCKATDKHLTACGQCLKQLYCSKDCQRRDWTVHKESCFTKNERKVQRQAVRDTTVKECQFCKKTEKAGEDIKLSACARCRAVRYCSAEHQRLDWPDHKKVCVNAGASKTNAPRKLLPAQVKIKQELVNAARCHRAGDRVGEGMAYGNLGLAFDSLGQFEKAVEYHNKHVAIAKELGR